MAIFSDFGHKSHLNLGVQKCFENLKESSFVGLSKTQKCLFQHEKIASRFWSEKPSEAASLQHTINDEFSRRLFYAVAQPQNSKFQIEKIEELLCKNAKVQMVFDSGGQIFEMGCDVIFEGEHFVVRHFFENRVLASNSGLVVGPKSGENGPIFKLLLKEGFGGADILKHSMYFDENVEPLSEKPQNEGLINSLKTNVNVTKIFETSKMNFSGDFDDKIDQNRKIVEIDLTTTTSTKIGKPEELSQIRGIRSKSANGDGAVQYLEIKALQQPFDPDFQK